MLEFLKEFRRLLWDPGVDNRLPDCTTILFLVRTNLRLDSRSAARYIALCRLTGVAIAVRYASILVLLATIALFVRGGEPEVVAMFCTATVSGVAMFGMLARLSAMLARGLTDGSEGGEAL